MLIPSVVSKVGILHLRYLKTDWLVLHMVIASNCPPTSFTPYIPLGTNDSSDLAPSPYTWTVAVLYRFSWLIRKLYFSSKIIWVSSVSVPQTPGFPQQWMLRTRGEAEVFWAIAPLLGFATHPALVLANQLRVNLRPHPGVFVADLSTYPGTGPQIGPVKVSVNGTSGEVPAAKTYSKGPSVPKIMTSKLPSDSQRCLKKSICSDILESPKFQEGLGCAEEYWLSEYSCVLLSVQVFISYILASLQLSLTSEMPNW